MKLIDFNSYSDKWFFHIFWEVFGKGIERILCVKNLNESYNEIISSKKQDNFFRKCLNHMNVSYSMYNGDLDGIPRSGPLVIVSNHPFGGIEGIILGEIISRYRSDLKILGNYLLHNVPEIKEMIIPVDPFGGRSAKKYNIKHIRESFKWVKEGGSLITFPAGEVASFNFKTLSVSDPEWSPHIGAVIRYANAAVLPVYFPGNNGFLFNMAGVFHPFLRTVLLPREFENKRGKNIKIYIGKPITWKRLESFNDNDSLMKHLRISTYFFKKRKYKIKRKFYVNPFIKTKQKNFENIISPQSKSAIIEEVESLKENRKLYEDSNYAVYCANSLEIPEVLMEIGRLREITFRNVGEGTGKPVDLDRFDLFYNHIFLWNKNNGEIAGAYRLALVDKIIQKFGLKGLYTSTLFKYRRDFFDHIEKTVELGRSFIRNEYQKQPSSLSNLWRGIGEFINRNPGYNILLGPVSISRDYCSVSKKLIVRFLRNYRFNISLSRYVKPRNPFKSGKIKIIDGKCISSNLRNIEDVSLLISEIEQDGKGIPILLRHYLKLNATIINFNVDKNFSNVVDSLIMVDLKETDPIILKRFLGKSGFENFISHMVKTAEVTGVESLNLN